MEGPSKRGIREAASPPTSRSLEAYLAVLQLTKEDLAGKNVLDIGSGTRGFAKGADNEGIDTQIVSLDPHYADMDLYKSEIMRESSPKVDSLTVAGVGEALPFDDNSFDLIVANYSMPFYTEDRLQAKEYFEELKRVIKPGGEIRIFPASAMGLSDLFVKWEKLKLKFDPDFSVETRGALMIIHKHKPHVSINKSSNQDI